MPCSAEIEPSKARTESNTSVLTCAFLLAQEGGRVAALGRLHVVVQVAVAQVAEVHQPHAGELAPQQRVGLGARTPGCATRESRCRA